MNERRKDETRICTRNAIEIETKTSCHVEFHAQVMIESIEPLPIPTKENQNQAAERTKKA